MSSGPIRTRDGGDLPPADPPALPRVAQWALAVPFFVMPMLLTIDAPDIHGGFGIHVWEALGLGLLGAVAALVSLWIPRILARVGPRVASVRSLGWLGRGALLLLAGHQTGSLAIPMADGLAAAVGQLPQGFGSAADSWGPGPPIRLALLVLALLAPRFLLPRPAPDGRREVLPALGLIASASLLTAAVRLVAFRGIFNPPWWIEVYAVTALVVLAVVWILIRNRRAGRWLTFAAVPTACGLWALPLAPSDPGSALLVAMPAAGLAIAAITRREQLAAVLADALAEPRRLLRLAVLAVVLVVTARLMLMGVSIISDSLASTLQVSADATANIASRRIPQAAVAVVLCFALAVSWRIRAGDSPVVWSAWPPGCSRRSSWVGVWGCDSAARSCARGCSRRWRSRCWRRRPCPGPPRRGIGRSACWIWAP